jgi:outer membrane biosynthesis protein TonB
MAFRAVSFGSAFILAVACSDKKQTALTDSSLARDLALASSQPMQPTFQDTAIAPEPVQAGRAKTPPEPVRTRTTSRPKTTPTRTPVRAPVREPVETHAPAPTPAPEPVSVAPAPAPAPVASIGAGTGFGVTSGSKVCSTALPGEKFVATLNGPVNGSNGAMIPAGATAVLEVASASGDDENATINFRVRAIVVGDKTYNVAASVEPEASLVRTKIPNPDGNADKKKVIGGAIIGGLLGQMIGHNTKGTIIGAAAGAATGAAVAKAGEKYEACLPVGSQLRITLSSALVMS